jgi:hypothetical protein
MSDLIGRFGQPARGLVRTTIVTGRAIPGAGGAVCDFQSRAESTGFSRYRGAKYTASCRGSWIVAASADLISGIAERKPC